MPLAMPPVGQTRAEDNIVHKPVGSTVVVKSDSTCGTIGGHFALGFCETLSLHPRLRAFAIELRTQDFRYGESRHPDQCLVKQAMGLDDRREAAGSRRLRAAKSPELLPDEPAGFL